VSGYLDGASRSADLTLSADAVVIGSGAGGAVAARVLSERGLSVICLEEGPRITAAEHGRMRPTESLRHVWRDGGMGFAVGLGDSPLINVTMGKVVGGSSMVTGGVCFRPPVDIVHRWTTERRLIDLAMPRLAPHLDTIERWVGVEEVPSSMRSRGVERFGAGLLAHSGHRLEPLRRNTHGCLGEGRCNFGCPHEAKLSVDLSVLPAAIARGALVVSGARVDRIVMRGSRATGVEGRIGRHHFTVHAPRVIVAAGAWHNPVLLKRSGFRGRAIGRHMTLHPSFRMMARFDTPVRGWDGALQSAYSPAFMDDGLTMVSLFVPAGVVIGAMPGFGPEHAARAADVGHVAVFGGLLHDEGGGRVWTVPGREPVVTYKMGAHERSGLPQAIRKMAEIFFAAGARECFLPVIGHAPVTPDSLAHLDLDRFPGRRFECTSQHPLGTCRMGVAPSDSAVDPRGRLWEADNVWVADGSIVPTSLGVNPQITVMAMAHRVASLLP
jgi:choline dehydrogenase-like flavoprotein